MNVSKITIGRLFNLGSYEHVRYELTVEIPAGESPATAIIGLEKILSALNPKQPSKVPTPENLETMLENLAAVRAMTDEQFKESYFNNGGARADSIAARTKDYAEGEARLKQWQAQHLKARKLLEDLGAAANWRDAKLDWDDDNG